MSLAPGIRLGAYEVTALIGAGGMGEVYRARDTRPNRDVALKILPDSFLSDADRIARFQREVKALFKFHRRSPRSSYDVSSDGQKFIVAESGEEQSQEPIVVISNWASGLLN